MATGATNENEFAAAVIESGRRALAGYAATELLERHPAVAAQFEPDATDSWRRFLMARLDELSAAMSVGQPRLFRSDLAWTRATFLAREVPVENLRAALDVLNSVLAAELPDHIYQHARTYITEAASELNDNGLDSNSILDVRTPHGRLAAEFLVAVLEGERYDAAKRILDAVEGGLPPRELYLHVLIPAARELGRMWHAGEVNVAEEHFATATIELVMCQLYPTLPRAPRHGRTVIAASVQGNRHGIAVRVLADLYEMDGWKVIHLGPDMPARDLALAVQDFGADLLALSITMSRDLRSASDVIRIVRQACSERPIRILVGGRAIDAGEDLWRVLGADAAASTLGEAIDISRRLVGLSGDAPRPS